jgi:ankyrin repeat protein
MAARMGERDAVSLLLAHKADINSRNKEGDTALHLAAFNDHVDVADLLLAGKADANVRNNLGNTPLKTAALKDNNDVVELLRQHHGR